MNSKERIRANLIRESTDRIPVWMWSHQEIIRRVQNKLLQQTGDIETILGNDIRSSWLNINREFTQETPAGERFTGDWGVV